MVNITIKSIVTHPRSAHRDEFLAVCVLLAHYGLVGVTRREATEEDLVDPQVVVVDTGMQHDPALMNFDHHQEKGMDCSFKLVMRALDLDELAQEHYPWYGLTNEADVNGMEETSMKRGIPLDAIRELVSPIETSLLAEFSKMKAVEPWLLGLMQMLGRDIADKLQMIADRMKALQKEAVIVRVGKHVGLVSELEDTPSLGLNEYRRKYAPEAVFTISPDGPKGGWTIHRCNDFCGLDFSPLEGREDMRFVHKSGFLAKTKTRIPLKDLLMLIRHTI